MLNLFMVRGIVTKEMSEKIACKNQAQVAKVSKKALANNDNIKVADDKLKSQILNQLAQIRGNFIEDFCIYEFETSKIMAKISENQLQISNSIWGNYISQRSENLLKYIENLEIHMAILQKVKDLISTVKKYEPMRNFLVHGKVLTVRMSKNSTAHITFALYSQKKKNMIEEAEYSLDALKEAVKEISKAASGLIPLATKVSPFQIISQKTL